MPPERKLPHRLKRGLLKLYALRKRWRLYFAAAVGFVIFVQILAFSPSRLEEEAPPPQVRESELLPPTEGSLVAPTLPKDRVPEYTVEGFQYVSAQAGVKQWKLNADQAFFYQKDGLVHTQNVHAIIYDAKGTETLVTAREAKYFFVSQDLELYGQVTTTFPDGMVTVTEYMKYEAKTRELTVPTEQLVTGKSQPTPRREALEFESHGLTYRDATQKVHLLSRVKVTSQRPTKTGATEEAVIESDRAVIDRAKDVATFSMNESRDEKLRFVHLTQPGLKARARRAEFRYGAKDRRLRTVRAMEEVKIEETPAAPRDSATNPRSRAPQTRYATAGNAEFDSIRNRIVLRDFPQVYQDRDTITGEVIIVHRDTNQVEVEQSNAYSDGNDES